MQSSWRSNDVINFVILKGAHSHLTDESQKIDRCSKTKGGTRQEKEELKFMYQLTWTDNRKQKKTTGITERFKRLCTERLILRWGQIF